MSYEKVSQAEPHVKRGSSEAGIQSRANKALLKSRKTVGAGYKVEVRENV